MNIRIAHPFIALFVIFGIAVILSNYGVVEGTAYLFVFFMGIALYRMFTSSSQSASDRRRPF